VHTKTDLKYYGLSGHKKIGLVLTFLHQGINQYYDKRRNAHIQNFLIVTNTSSLE
jgi:hypothetical protein